MTISEGMYATLQLYFAVVAFVYILITIAVLFSYALVYLLYDDPETEQGWLDTTQGE